MFCLKGDFSILIPAHPCSVRINVLLYWSLFRGSSWFSCYVILGLNCGTRPSRPILLWRNIFHRFAQLSSKIGSKSLIRPVANSWDEFKRSRDTRERNPFSSELGSRTKKKIMIAAQKGHCCLIWLKNAFFLNPEDRTPLDFATWDCRFIQIALFDILMFPTSGTSQIQVSFFFYLFFVSLLWH